MGPEGPPESLSARHLQEKGCLIVERTRQRAPASVEEHLGERRGRRVCAFHSLYITVIYVRMCRVQGMGI